MVGFVDQAVEAGTEIRLKESVRTCRVEIWVERTRRVNVQWKHREVGSGIRVYKELV
jgi:hypothetical protein